MVWNRIHMITKKNMVRNKKYIQLAKNLNRSNDGYDEKKMECYERRERKLTTIWKSIMGKENRIKTNIL